MITSVSMPLSRQRTLPKLFSLKSLYASIALTMTCATSQSADLATLQKLPLFSINQMQYAGGFRLPTGDYGESNVTYSEGPIAIGADGTTMYVVGHTYQQAIAEFRIPQLVNSLKVTDFNTAAVVQNFSRVLDRPASGNPQGMDRIGGMAYINGQLVVNTYVYYDASVSATHTTLAVKDASKLSSSSVGGYYSYSARAHATGWISSVPSDWQSVLGGTHIAGDSSGKAIISRLSVGPSAFVFNPTNPQIGTLSPSTISLATLLDYSLDNPMGIVSQTVENFLGNTGLTNTIWTHLSRGLYGFIVPGTRTYLVVGYNGGMASGVGYKITPRNGDGQPCGGYCAYDAKDYSNYYWAFDMNDLIKVKSGQLTSYKVLPYASGKLTQSYANNGYNPIIGATFDGSRGLLYVSLERGDPGSYDWAPSIVAFKIGTNTITTVPTSPTGLSIQ